jgi:hypothetical protein
VPFFTFFTPQKITCQKSQNFDVVNSDTSEFFDMSLFGALKKFFDVANSAPSKTFLTCHCLTRQIFSFFRNVFDM